MARKKWTAQTEITPALIRLREKRKWQIALRRYVREGKWSASYAPYFGIDIAHFREWIALQFEGEISWDSFGEGWQFDHILPLVYFDFEKDAELRLCWNFTNIRVQRVLPESEASGLDILGAKAYFETLYTRTGYPLCREMLDKIKRLEGAQLGQVGKQVSFLNQNMSLLTTVASFNAYEYGQLNEGIPLEKILEEKRMFQ